MLYADTMPIALCRSPCVDHPALVPSTLCQPPCACANQPVPIKLRLLNKLPAVDDLQAAWLLLLMCASPRSNYLARMLPPSVTRAYAEAHDDGVIRCLDQLLNGDTARLFPFFSVARLTYRYILEG